MDYSALHKSFYPRPRARGDRSISSMVVALRRFYPRPRARGDCAALYPLIYRTVSIHAPARGATSHDDAIRHAASVFLSTPPREGRHLTSENPPPHQCFYPRPRARGDNASPCSAIPRVRFSPRPRARGDVPRGLLCRPHRVSIHAPARGATISASEAGHGSVSIHAPARGATCHPRAATVVSIHAPARGATLSCIDFSDRFRSTPPREGRR